MSRENATGALRAILDSSPLAIVAVDNSGRVTTCNPAAETMFGWSADEALGASPRCVPPEDRTAFDTVLRAVLAGEVAYGNEVKLLRKDGSHIDVSLSLAPMRDASGDVAGAVGTLADVSDRKAAEEERDATSRIAELALSRGRMVAGRLDVATGGLSWIGSDGGASFWQKAPPDTVDELLELVHPDDRGAVGAAALSSDAQVSVEFRVVDEQGSTRWLSAHGLLVGDDEPGSTRVGVISDVTESRNHANELRRTSETLQAIITASPLALTTTDLDGHLTTWSPAAERMFGWTEDEVLGKPLPFVPDEDASMLADLRARVLAGETVIDQEAERRHKDGSLLTVSLSLAPLRDADGLISGIVGLLTDISDRKRAEAEIAERNAELLAMQETLATETAEFNAQLRRAARDLELLLEREKDVHETLSTVVTASPVPIIAIDSSRAVTMWNPAAERTFGWTAEEVLLRPAPFTPLGKEAEVQDLQDRVLSGEVITDFHTTRVRRDGKAIDVTLSLAPLRKNGDVVGYVGITADVTDRLRSERELREAEARYRTLVEQIPAIVYLDLADGEGTTLYVSPQIEWLLGISQEEWLRGGLDIWLEHIHPDDRAQVMSTYLETTELGKAYDLEYRLVRRDGVIRWFRDQVQVLPNAGHRPAELHGVMLDITELKQAQDEIARNLDQLERTDLERRRLVSLLVSSQEAERRRIAADIHDDTIQAMAAVGLRLGAMRSQLDRPESLESLKELEKSVSAAIGRLRHLLFELRPAELDRGGLASALARHLEQGEADYGLRSRLDSRLSTEPSSEARTVAYRIAQEALANVRRHARATLVEVSLDTVEEGVLVTVRDDGQGFGLEEALTRPVSGHLGLIAMRERAEMAGGWLRISSKPGVGTTVEFWIPQAFESPEEPAS